MPNLTSSSVAALLCFVQAATMVAMAVAAMVAAAMVAAAMAVVATVAEGAGGGAVVVEAMVAGEILFCSLRSALAQ